MLAFALQTTDLPAIGRIEEVAREFGINWPHLMAQAVSFTIVCAVLYWLAYRPILDMLETRRQQIASGLANAARIESELARIDAERLDVLARAEDEGMRLIEDARAAAARLDLQERSKAAAAAALVLRQAHEQAALERARILADVRSEVGRLVVAATAAVTAKVLTPDDQRRLAREAARELR
jgi:F-type H+-transporting ATPase subunit b